MNVILDKFCIDLRYRAAQGLWTCLRSGMTFLRANRLKLAVLCVGLAILDPSFAGEPRYAKLPSTVTPSRYDIDVKVDPDALRFEGANKITIEVHEKTRVITLNAAALAIDSVALSRQAAAASNPAKATLPKAAATLAPSDTRLDATAETAAFTFAEELAPGAYTLTVRYHGTIILDGSRGLYAVDSETPQGKTRMLKTFFAPSDFRRFAPAWDQPDRKVVIALTVTAPAKKLVIANNKAQSREELPGGWQKVTFVPTPKTCTDTAFLAIGDWDRVTRQVDGIEVGLLVPRGHASRTAFAMDAITELLKYYNGYFGVKYPLPKLDFMSGLGAGGGVANFGMISIGGANALLLDRKTSSAGALQSGYELIAHELAHQWFGNLLTAPGMEDLWLDEGFATWMEYAAPTALHPQWQSWLKFISEDEESIFALDAAMAVDSRSGASHPVVDPSGELHADTLTYQKGAAVVRMLAAYLGPDAFRAGMRRYMQEYQFGNPTTKDMLAAFERGSGKPVTQIGQDFLMQDGLPLIVVDAGKNGGVALRQERVGADAVSRSAREWHVPVTVRSLDGRTTKQVIVSQSAPQELADLKFPVIVNADRTAYARTRYSAAAFKSLLAGYARLPAADQLTLLSDNWALTAAGYQPVGNLLDLLAAVANDADPLVWNKAARATAQVANFLRPGKDRDAYLAFARGHLSPQLQRLGWDPKPAESDNTAALRITLINTLSALDDPAVLAESRRLFAAAGDDPAKLNSAKGNAALAAVGLHANEATAAKLRQMAQKARDPMTRMTCYRALYSAKAPALAARALEEAERSLNGEDTDLGGTTIIGVVAMNSPDLAWKFAVAHREQIYPRLESVMRNMYFPFMVRGSLQAERAKELDAFARQYMPADGRSMANQVRAQIEEAARLADRLPAEVGAWLRRSPKGAASSK